MARIALSLFAGLGLAGLALAGCSQNEEGRKAVAARCVSDGRPDAVCTCLADESAKKLDKEMFDIVVMGAKGDDEEAERQVKELAKDRQVLFSVTVAQVKSGCEAAAAQTPQS